MSHVAQPPTPPTVAHRRQATLLSFLGLAAALAALVGASCCALPLVLASLGLAGAWIANLGIFVSYRSYLTVVAVVVIALGWVVAFRRGASRRTLVVLACASVLVLAALFVAHYEGEITRHLIALRRK